MPFALFRKIADTGGKASIYTKLHATGGGSVQDRTDNCQEMVNQYYDMATDFYEFGWGESFHFAPRNPNESFRESLTRHEHYLALKMGVKAGDRVLDMGCGVGGPMREIAGFSGANVVGINNNAYQVARGTAKNAKLGLFGGACLAVLYYVFVVPLHHKLLIAGVAGLASRAFPALKGALLTNPTNLSVATIVSSLGGDGDASVVALAAVTAATKARARRMSISAVEFAKRNATPHKKKPSAMHAHAE